MTNHNDDFDRMARAAGAALRRPAPEGALMRVRAVRKRRQVVRTTMVGLAAVAIVVAGVYAAKGDRRVSDAPTTPVPSTVDMPVVESPVALSTVPEGFRPDGRSVRPAGGEATVGAVFVQRDTGGTMTERVVAYLRDDIYRGQPGIGVPTPANLQPVEGSSLTLFTPTRSVRLEYGLGDRGYLILVADHDDLSTTGALTDAMQAIAASLAVEPGLQLGVAGDLPEGWSLATASAPPEEVVPAFYQAFEVDQPDGGNKIMVDNRFIQDSGYPYWVAYQTLAPVTVRGHEGFVTFHNEYGPSGDTPEPTNESAMLIWEETPGHWVTLWAGGMTTEEALALADQLVPVPVGDWGAEGGFATTTTTLG